MISAMTKCRKDDLFAESCLADVSLMVNFSEMSRILFYSSQNTVIIQEERNKKE
jgi:hypothetical protein